MSYVSVAEATELVNQLFLVESTDVENWYALGGINQQICLNKAFRVLEAMPFTGRPATLERAFPRENQSEVPVAVKEAQVLLAVDFANPDVAKERARVKKLQVSGVTSYRIGKFAETLKEGGSTWENPEVLALLKPWLEGGFRIV